MIKKFFKFFSRDRKDFAAAIFGAQQETTKLKPKECLEYYSKIAPLNNAINIIINELGQIRLAVKDKKNDELIYEHDLLNLLLLPSADSSQYEFITQLALFFRVTGNAFVIATGPQNRPPLELLLVNPANVGLQAGSDGFLECIEVNTQSGAQKFQREEVDGRFRFYSNDAEIWYMRNSSPFFGTNDLWGFSDLSAISLELQQYHESGIHNLSLLKRGASPSAILQQKYSLSDDQQQALAQHLSQFYSGARNTGRALLLPPEISAQSFTQSNRDMDFASLKREVTLTIYNHLKIPLPFVDVEGSTYSNLATSKLSLYDHAVLPLASRLLEELSLFLLPRYRQPIEQFELTYDEEDLHALEPRRMESISKLRESHVLTINETRALLGYEPVEGGDELLIPSNMISLESSYESIDEFTKRLDIERVQNKCNH